MEELELCDKIELVMGVEAPRSATMKNKLIRLSKTKIAIPTQIHLIVELDGVVCR
jgi:hypothetical protein